MMATMLLAVGLLGASNMLTRTTQGQITNANRALATTLAREQLERIRQADYTTITAANYPQENYGAIVGYEQFQRTVAIAVNTPDPNTKQITVTVSWRGPSGALRHTTLNTIVTP